MRNNAGIFLGLAIVSGVVWALWPAPTTAPTSPTSTVSHGDLDDAFYNRFWIERMPERMTDKIDVLVMADPQVGVFQRTSAFEGDYTLFEWSTSEAGKLKIVMLQSQKRHDLTYKVSNRGCGAFDYCARVKGAPRGAKRYFSMEDWVLSPGDRFDADAIRTRIYRRLSGASGR